MAFVAAAVAATPATAVAAPQELPAEESAPTVQDLQRQIDELTERVDSTPVKGTSGATVKMFGRIHADVWHYPESDDAINVFESDDPNVDPRNGFEFRRVRFGMSGKINTRMNYKFELDFAHPDEQAFKDVTVGFEDLPVLHKLLIGNQKRPYGLDHLNSSRYNVFIARPLVIEAVNQDARRPGIMSYGLSDDEAWNWRVGAFNMENWSQTGTYVSDRIQPEFAARIANTALWENGGRKYAHWALSGTYAFPDGDPQLSDASNQGRFRTRPEARTDSRWIDTGRIAGIDSYQVAAAEGVWNDGPLQLVGEYQRIWVSVDDANDPGFEGGYVQAAYFLTGEHMPWNRKSGQLGRQKPLSDLLSKDGGAGWGAWQVALRYSFADFSDEAVRGGRGEALTFGLNWYFNPNASLQLNYTRGEISGRNEDVGGTLFREGDYEIFGIRLRADF